MPRTMAFVKSSDSAAVTSVIERDVRIHKIGEAYSHKFSILTKI